LVTQLREQLSALKERLEDDAALDGQLYGRVVSSVQALLDASGQLQGQIEPCGSSVQEDAQGTEARLEAVVKTAVDAIITIDATGTIESVNPSTERMFGLTAEELVGRNVSILMPSPYRQEHDSYLHRYLETGEKHIIGIGREVVGRRKDGGEFPIDLAVSEFTINGRRMFTGIIRDISDRKELERQVLDIATQEQQRIGRDLHDSLGQELTGIAFLTGVLQKGLAARGLPQAEDAAEIVALANQAIDHTRALVRGLCPVKLDAEGLMLALEQLAEDVKDVHGVRCRFACPDTVLIDDHQAATHLYYIANEAVNNALRHGRPRRIDIELRASASRGALSVRDDGVGIASADPGTGRGMHLMRYRARTVGGSLEVASGAERGTAVTCTFDLKQARQENT
jgi:PAS domain S-box-containing protein